MDNYMNLPVTEDEGNPLSPVEQYNLQMREKAKKRRKERAYFAVGFTVIIFAVVGIVGSIVQTAVYFSSRQEDKMVDNLSSYHSFMLSVAAVDPEPFDDISASPMDQLVDIAVWSIIGSDLDPSEYDYSSGELAIPASDVENAFYRYFGNTAAIAHCSVTGYGYEFSYDADTGIYYVPLTAVEPLYTPVVTDGETKGDTVVLTVGLVNTGSWQQNAETGYMEMPEPDKYIRVTLRKTSSGPVISAIQTSSRPETAIVQNTAPSVQVTEGAEADTTEATVTD